MKRKSGREGSVRIKNREGEVGSDRGEENVYEDETGQLPIPDVSTY